MVVSGRHGGVVVAKKVFPNMNSYAEITAYL